VTIDEMIQAARDLVTERFGGDRRAAWQFYAGQDGMVGRDEITTFLLNAGIGGWITRGVIASTILKEVDTDGDGRISWDEGQAAIEKYEPEAAK
jgi:hypothetical protein